MGVVDSDVRLRVLMPPASPGRARKGIGLPGSPVIWIGVLVVALGAGAWLLYKRSQASSSASDSGTGDASGDTADDAGQLGTLQSEIGDLQSSVTSADEQVQVPDVVGMTQERANSVITAAGLKPAGAPVQPGKTLTVNAQAPAGGALADKGSVVALQSTVKAVPAASKPAPKPAPKPKPKPKPKPVTKPRQLAR